MTPKLTFTRRVVLAGGLAGGAAVAAPRPMRRAATIDPAIDGFAQDYLRTMHAPGMILGIADASGPRGTATFGVADLEARRTISADERFHIGSITKSFTALMVLQLAQEGKVDLHAPITDYLPALGLKAPFGPVSVHHLLTHSGGLPAEPPAPGWPDQSVEQVWAPGSRFHYCNMGYRWLGRLIEAQGAESWTQALHRRILMPLGMTETFALIGPGMRAHEVPSYVARADDRPYPRGGPLTRAPSLSFSSAAGCIASTARDMNRYITMLCRHGEGPSGRLITAAHFELMTKSHIEASEFGPGAGYGYGWMIDKVDGRSVIRHTGGMVSFMSSLHVDPAAGVGAFASINAMQGYRPVPVTAEAVRVMRALADRRPAPATPPFDPDQGLKIDDYLGDYVGLEGQRARVDRNQGRLTIAIDGAAFALASLGNDNFAGLDPRYRLFAFAFQRERPADGASEAKRPVIGFGWGGRAFVRPGRPLPAPVPDRLRGYEGYFVSNDPWTPSARVVARDGRLWLDGLTPLDPLEGDRFRFADEPGSPEIAAFSPAQGGAIRFLTTYGIIFAREGGPEMELS